MSLEHQAEMLKLARLLAVERAELHMLESVSADELRRFRGQANRRLHAEDAHIFKRIVSASRLLPVPLLTVIAEHALGPLLAAKVAGLMDIERGVGIAGRLPSGFLAQLCLHLDPVSAAPLIRAIPQEQIVSVALDLAARGEFITMGQFVDVLTDNAIIAVIDRLDNASLLRSAFFVENKTQLNAIVDRMSDTRLRDLILCAASDADLWPEALGLMRHLSPDIQSRLANLAADQDPAVLGSMVVSIRQHRLWVDALPVMGAMTAVSQARFANLAEIQRPDTLLEIIDIACAQGLWPQVLPLLDVMNDVGRDLCAAQAAQLDGEQLLSLVRAAAEGDWWPQVLDLAQRIDEPYRQDIVALMGLAPQAVVDHLMPALESLNQWSLLAQSWSRMGEGARSRLQRAATAGKLEHRLNAALEGSADMHHRIAQLEAELQRCRAALDPTASE